MSQEYSSLERDFLSKSKKLETLGEGTFGTVCLYDTPLGRYVVKTTKMVDKSLGYPPDFLTEVDTLIKFRCLNNVVKMSAVFFDDEDKKGYILLEQMDANLSIWAKKTPYNKRIEYVPSAIKQLGDVLRIMHTFKFVHNDMKTNNILVKYQSGDVIFKVADFGKTYYVRDNSSATYGAIEKYKPPTPTNIFSSEYWSLFVVITEMILGGNRMVNLGSAESFYYQYSTENRFDLVKYLKKHLTTEEFKQIPQIYWDFSYPIIHDLNATLINVMADIDRPIDSSKIREITKTISKSEPKHEDISKIHNEFKNYFKYIGLENYFERFVRLLNKFIVCIRESLDRETLRCYAEVAYVIIAKSKADKYHVFKTQSEFLTYQRAFLTKLKFQIIIL